METKEAFKKLWSSWFHFVDTATGRRLEIPVFDGGRGHLINFATDGDAAQAGALGETLSERYNSQIHGIVQENPDVFLKAVLRLCWVHADAYVKFHSRATSAKSDSISDQWFGQTCPPLRCRDNGIPAGVLFPRQRRRSGRLR